MITSEALEGVPILVLANKQDVEVRLLQIYFLNEQISLGKVTSASMLNLFHIPGLILWCFAAAGNSWFEFSFNFFLSPPTSLCKQNRLRSYGGSVLYCDLVS